MTWLLALGWLVAAFAGWRWRLNLRRAWELVEHAERALDMADFWKALAATKSARVVDLEDEVADLRAAAIDWQAAVVVWQAVAMRPLQPESLTGKVQ